MASCTPYLVAGSGVEGGQGGPINNRIQSRDPDAQVYGSPASISTSLSLPLAIPVDINSHIMEAAVICPSACSLPS